MPSTFEDSPNGEESESRNRRQFLFCVGATTLLAGCLGDESGDPEPTGAENNDTTTSQPAEESSPAGGLSRAEARDLLPLEALAFRYQPALGNRLPEFWATVVGETEAAAVRAEAESGGANEVRPKEGTIDGTVGVPVPVDPSGDEVTVFAIDKADKRGRVTSIDVPTDDLTAEAALRAVPSEALSFTYDPPDAGQFGRLTVEVTEETEADTLVAQPREAPGVFSDRVGNLADEAHVGPGTALGVAVDPEGDEVVISTTVDGATGELTRWQGPE